MRVGRRKRNRQRGKGNRVCERDKQVYFDSRGSPTATAHLSSSPFSRSRNSQRASEAHCKPYRFARESSPLSMLLFMKTAGENSFLSNVQVT